MEILKRGITEHFPKRKFTCPDCGCVYIAKWNEVGKFPIPHTFCPTCERRIDWADAADIE